MVAIHLRRARAVNTVVFVIVGAVGAAWATRVPAVQQRLDLSPGELGLAVAGLELGAVLGLPLGGALVARLGSRLGVRAGVAVYPTALLGVANAPNLALLAAALAVMAAANSVVDVAMNVQGVELERRYGRPLLSSLHAGHSVGLLGGGLAGTAAAAADVSLGVRLGVTAVLGVLVGLAATGGFVDETVAGARPAMARPRGALLLLGLLAFCAFLLDGAAYQWSAVHLRLAHDATPGLAAAAFTAFTLTLTLGRLAGDRVVARLGRARTVRTGGLVAAAGCALALAAPGPLLGIAGWAVFGLGLATFAPVVLSAAAAAGDTPAPVAIAGVTTIGYLGSFTGPPLIGVVADATTITTALAALVGVAIIATLLARRALRQRRPAGGPHEWDSAAAGPTQGRVDRTSAG